MQCFKLSRTTPCTVVRRYTLYYSDDSSINSRILLVNVNFDESYWEQIPENSTFAIQSQSTRNLFYILFPFIIIAGRY